MGERREGMKREEKNKRGIKASEKRRKETKNFFFFFKRELDLDMPKNGQMRGGWERARHHTGHSSHSC